MSLLGSNTKSQIGILIFNFVLIRDKIYDISRSSSGERWIKRFPNVMYIGKLKDLQKLKTKIAYTI